MTFQADRDQAKACSFLSSHIAFRLLSGSLRIHSRLWAILDGQSEPDRVAKRR